MATPKRGKDDRPIGNEIERYRQAAINALGQLEWCVEYFHELRSRSWPGRLRATGSRSWSAQGSFASNPKRSCRCCTATGLGGRSARGHRRAWG
jgi:hypothetical protein